MSGSRWWCRLALESGDHAKSLTAALRSRAPMAAAAFCSTGAAAAPGGLGRARGGAGLNRGADPQGVLGAHA
jgi:hypothetical protein